ncbi:ribonuclease P protein component [Roseivirga pacifica]|uniref:ribonuclease P protein component n=1 Tax=Roseivirga pacifica TaxID=1267423 RepID=UPI003BA9550C
MTEVRADIHRNTFPKRERLYKKKLIQELFDKGSSFYLYPFKVIYFDTKEENVPNQVLFSVSKRKFKTAVARNRIKRQLREGYRLNKRLAGTSGYLIAFIYTADKQQESRMIHKKMMKALQKLAQLHA